jgi:hypothetical protein
MVRNANAVLCLPLILRWAKANATGIPRRRAIAVEDIESSALFAK